MSGARQGGEPPTGFEVERTEGFDDLSDHDKRELRLFETYLRGLGSQKAGEAVAAPELLYAVVYGHSEEDPGTNGGVA